MIIYKEVKYIIPEVESNYQKYKMGYIEAWDINTGQRLWEKRIYDVKIIPGWEEDIQWVFITNLSIRNGKLVVSDEKGIEYEIDVNTGEILSITYIPSISR